MCEKKIAFVFRFYLFSHCCVTHCVNFMLPITHCFNNVDLLTLAVGISFFQDKESVV